MSRIGMKPIEIPSGVTVITELNVVKVKGPKGQLEQDISRTLTVEQEDGVLSVKRPNNSRMNRAQHGLARTLINNMCEGVTKGHSKVLEIHGVGFRAQAQGTTLVLNVGYSHEVEVVAPAGISFEVSKEERGKVTEITVSGISKADVGQVAADVRKVRKPDPYKGKGLRYKGEEVKLRPGKRAAGTA